MSTVAQVQVERAIVHIINHLKPQQSVKSTNVLPLTSNLRLKDYFEAQIANSLRNSALSQAVFDDDAIGPDTTANLCLTAIAQSRKFIASSQDLADALLSAMGKDKRITEKSNLAICLYTTPPAPEKYLALLKLDPSEALIQKIERDPSSASLLVNFEVREDAMPTANEPLQKAALVLSKRSAEGHDLLLLDKQVSKEAADFFARKFLHAQPILDAKKRTKKLYNALAKAHQRLTPIQPVTDRPHLDLDKADMLRDEIDSVMRRSKIDTSEWIDSLALPDDAKQVIEKEIQKQIPVEKEFELDPEYAQENVLYKKRRIKGAYGVVFEVESDHWKDVIKKEVSRKVVAGHQIVRLEVEITDYQEVIKK